MRFYLVGIFACLASASAETVSPCPSLFQYTSLDEPGQWEGALTLKSEEDLHGVWIRVFFDLPPTNVSVLDNFGEVVTRDHTDFLIKNRDHLLKADQPTKVKLVVKYEGATAPKFTGFRLNARTACPAHGGEFNWISSLQSQSNDFFLGDLNNKEFVANRPTAPAVPGCGVVPLASSGKAEGQWPWHASLYLSAGDQQQFVCGATLVSPNRILTAAHCVARKGSIVPLNADVLKVSLGKFYQETASEGLQEARVVDVVLHPGYNPNNLYSDLAVLKLDKAVKYTDYVRPACLWQESADLGTILRRDGVVVGWGFDSEGRYTDRLTQAKLSVSPLDVCLNANPNLSTFISDKSFCTRYSKAVGICAGESGSGLLFPRDGDKPVYQLRGIQTVGPALQNQLACDDTTQIVFLDAAKYSKWIEAAIQN